MFKGVLFKFILAQVNKTCKWGGLENYSNEIFTFHVLSYDQPTLKYEFFLKNFKLKGLKQSKHALVWYN
jgi:hypothetical protein